MLARLRALDAARQDLVRIRREKCPLCGVMTHFPILHFLSDILIAIYEPLLREYSWPAVATFQKSSLCSSAQKANKSIASITSNSPASSQNRSAQPRRSSSEPLPLDKECLMPRPSEIRWHLECGHTIVCGCRHRVGEKTYCIHCSAYKVIRKWSKFDGPATSESTGRSSSGSEPV